MAACIWTKHRPEMGFASCKQVYWHLSEDYRFCPFCGSPIDVRWPQVVSSTVTVPTVLPQMTESVRIPGA